MTNRIDQKYVFEKIVYFDENYKEFSWYPNQTLPENLNLSYFFINQYKCFEVRYRMNPFDIYSSYVFNILRVELNRQIATYLFSFRSRDSPNLIDYYEFRANVSYYLNFDFMHEEFSDQFQVGSIKKSYFFPNLFRKLKNGFRLQWCRSPMLLYRRMVGDDRIKYADISSYIGELKAELRQRANVTTTLMPLSRKDFEYEIKNEVFLDMIRLVEIKEMLSVSDENYQRNYYNMLLSVNEPEGLSLVLMKKVIQ